MISLPLITSGFLRSRSTWRARFESLCSFPVMLAAGLMLLTFWSCAERFDDPDLWWHLKVGEEMWKTQRIPTADQFSSTTFGHPWVAHEWLAQLILFAVYQAGGYSGLIFLLSVTSSTIVVLSFLLCGRWSGNWKVSLIGGLSALFFLTSGLSIRPALFGYLFLVVELLLLYAVSRGHGKALLALPVVFVIWANCHGSFLFGLAVLAAIFGAMSIRVAAGRIEWRRSDRAVLACTCVAACWIAPFVNPIGARMVTYPLGLLSTQSENISYVAEWAALNLQEPRAIGFAALLALVILATVLRWIVLTPLEWILLSTVTAMATSHVRMLPIFGIISAPVLCRILATQWDNYDPRKDHPILNCMLILTALSMSAAVMPNATAIDRQIAAKEPVAAVKAIQQARLPGPLLNEYSWGGFLMWANPAQKVFIDGRFDLYAWTGILDEFRRWALLQEDPRRLLDRYGIRTCLIRSTSPMANIFPLLPEWKRVYDDGLAAVYAR
jgi:hypothetical protein